MYKKLSEKGIELLKLWEKGPKGSFAKEIYICSGGKKTIGYGHVVKKSDSIAPPIDSIAAEELLILDIKTSENAVNFLVKVELTQNQFDALVCFTFNVGVGAFQISTLLSLLNKKQYDKIPEQMARWNKVTVNGEKLVRQGLIDRRKAEINLWKLI
jgi:lysozyme